MSISVLAVDDSRTMRDMITLVLSTEGFDVQLAEDGLHGLEVLDEMAPDVIITDINMPRMDGFDFIDAVRHREDAKTIDNFESYAFGKDGKCSPRLWSGGGRLLTISKVAVHAHHWSEILN